MGAKWDFYKDLALTSLDVIAFHVGRKLSPETLQDIAEKINRGLFVPVQPAELCRQSSYSIAENGRLFLDGLTLDSYVHGYSRGNKIKLRSSLVEDKWYRSEVSQKMAQRIAKAAERQGFEVPPYVQYRATRSDGKIAKYAQSAAKYAAMALSWFVVGGGGVSHLVEFCDIKPITDSCEPAVAPHQMNAPCYIWRQKDQAVSIWEKRRENLNKSVPFYTPSVFYGRTQRIPYSDVPNHPEAVDALTAYAGKAGCPTASSQKLRQTFEGISRLPSTPEVKRAATVRVVEQIVQTPKNACSML